MLVFVCDKLEGLIVFDVLFRAGFICVSCMRLLFVRILCWLCNSAFEVFLFVC